MSNRYNLRSRTYKIDPPVDLFDSDYDDEFNESDEIRIKREIYSGFLMQLVGDQIANEDGSPSKIINMLNKKYNKRIGVVCADGDVYEALRSNPRTDVFQDKIISHNIRGETCAHFVYYDGDGIIHDSWLTGRQCDDGNQFCQNHALLMAYEPQLRNDNTMTRMKAIRQLLEFWDKNLLGMLKVSDKEDLDKNFDNLANTNAEEDTFAGMMYGETIILDMSNLVKRGWFKKLRDKILNTLSTTGSIIDMADWV
jgi:hypothetical protein